MIDDLEVRRVARLAGVEPRVVELDYALGWALRGIADHEYLAPRLVFKGGTSLRKCRFPEYRFSEDLDFTAIEQFDWGDLGRAMREAFAHASEVSGIGEPRLDIVNDEYGRESLRLTVYWRGPHARRGSPPGLRLDVTRNEVVLFEPVRRRVVHGFGDADVLGPLEIACYSLDEVMAEKIRAVLGQRRHAVSRDLYDIFALREHTDEAKVLSGLPEKFAARDLAALPLDPRRLEGRREEFRADWERNLAGLLPPGAQREFGDIWETVATYVNRIASALDR